MVLYAPRLNSAMTAAISRKRGTGREWHFCHSHLAYQNSDKLQAKTDRTVVKSAKVGGIFIIHLGFDKNNRK